MASEFNDRIIEEFRANGGKVGGRFEGARLLLLTTTGAKTGERRLNPLAYRPDGDNVAVFASFAGGPKHPAWFHNLKANPDVTVEVGTETYSARARITEGAERDRIWSAQKADAVQFAEYERATDREIPVIVLERS